LGGKRHTIEQILEKLDRAERAVANGRSTRGVCRELGVSEPTCYRWRKVYGVSRADLAKRVKDLEKPNARLRALLAEQILKGSDTRNGTGQRGGPTPHS